MKTDVRRFSAKLLMTLHEVITRCDDDLQEAAAQRLSEFFAPSFLKNSEKSIEQFLTKKRVEKVEHPPYSPDLHFPDFFLFPRFKLALKGKRFDDIPDIQRNVTRLLNSILKEDFLQSF
ncbi:histone-lysine N-methyltransferase SETMAR [Trichonephila clavipes]|nr:histone-lysine N-methyltransferase SETMAR [Trichonephila clavipes]